MNGLSPAKLLIFPEATKYRCKDSLVLLFVSSDLIRDLFENELEQLREQNVFSLFLKEISALHFGQYFGLFL